MGVWSERHWRDASRVRERYLLTSSRYGRDGTRRDETKRKEEKTKEIGIDAGKRRVACGGLIWFVETDQRERGRE